MYTHAFIIIVIIIVIVRFEYGGMKLVLGMKKCNLRMTRANMLGPQQ